MCLRPADVRMYWRFAVLLRDGLAAGLPTSDLIECRDELESIARHTQDSGLRDRCEALTGLFETARDAEFSIVPIWEEMFPDAYDDLRHAAHP